MKKLFVCCAATLIAATVATVPSNAQRLQEGFTVNAASIGKPAADGISGTITKTGGSNYRVRSMNGTWWMIQNADKPLTSSDDCTYPSIDRGEYGHLYSWTCAEGRPVARLIENNTLVALTLMIAESRTEEKDVIVKVIVNLINKNN
jgi:hypothetical protein